MPLNEPVVVTVTKGNKVNKVNKVNKPSLGVALLLLLLPGEFFEPLSPADLRSGGKPLDTQICWNVQVMVSLHTKQGTKDLKTLRSHS